MAVALPIPPTRAVGVPRLFPEPKDLRQTITGGAVQRISRIGTRFMVSVNLTGLLAAGCGATWHARLLRARGETAVMRVPQPGLEIGNPGSDVKVYGGGQAGSRLSVHQMTPGYTVRENQLFHLFINGRHYLHQVTAAAVVSGQGRALLDIAPPLRVTPPDGAHVNFTDVNIEGWVVGFEPKRGGIARVLAVSFDIEEAE